MRRFRRGAYQQTDVFMIVFSVGDPESFENVTKIWHREGIFSFVFWFCFLLLFMFLLVSYHCPNAPIVLVGCQMDYRKQKAVAKLLIKKSKPITTAQVSITCFIYTFSN
jgi:GTPase SAR1 family protein